jgi:hypothetical protein
MAAFGFPVTSQSLLGYVEGLRVACTIAPLHTSHGPRLRMQLAAVCQLLDEHEGRWPA